MDLVVIALLTRIGFFTLAAGFALLLVGLAVRKPGMDVMGKVFRVAVGCLGVLVVTITVLVAVLARYAAPAMEDPAVQAALEEVLRDVRPPEARGSGQTGAGDAVPGDTTVDAAAPEQPAPAESRDMAVTPESAADMMAGSGSVEARDSVVTPAEIALDSIARLNLRVEALRGERDDSRAALRTAQQELAQARERSPLQWLWDLVEDLGLGFGWGALYLTLTHAWWKGTSVGKRLFRIRVVMIDKRPLSLWLSFERAGGYAAGFATGLLGFAQVFWDPNRQAIHDKVSETIVIQEGKEPVPGPWLKEGEDRWPRGRPELREPGGP